MAVHNHRPISGWVANNAAQPQHFSQKEAREKGFRPRPSSSATEYVLVPTSSRKGFRRQAAATYYSVWGR